MNTAERRREGCGTSLAYMADVPPEHVLVMHSDESHSPLIAPGEFAVVDTRDRGLSEGRLCAVATGSRPRIWALRRSSWSAPRGYPPGERVWWLSPARRQDIDKALALDPRPILHVSDGPMCDSDLAAVMLGRVVGIYDPASAAAIQKVGRAA